MSNSAVSDPTQNTATCELGVSFGRASDGLLVAKVNEDAFAMIAMADGGHYFASAWRLSKPMEEWAPSDFYGHGGRLRDEADFHARVDEMALHQRQRAALARRKIHSHVSTPWGVSQVAHVYADGIVSHSTSSHGGFHLEAARNPRVHPALRASDGWYEEDCAWAAVAQAYPDLFTDYERRCADQTLRDFYPEAWEAIEGRALLPGESRERDRATFEQAHGSCWIVISAILSDRFPSMTECLATLGGDRRSDEQRLYLVPSETYQVSRFGFVIDEACHQRLDQPPERMARRSSR